MLFVFGNKPVKIEVKVFPAVEQTFEYSGFEFQYYVVAIVFFF